MDKEPSWGHILIFPLPYHHNHGHSSVYKAQGVNPVLWKKRTLMSPLQRMIEINELVH